jgi:hypothetical protein
VLIRTLFIVALFGVVAETIVHGANALAQVALRRAAASSVQRQMESATTEVQRALAQAIEAGGDPQNLDPTVPAPKATCVLAAAAGCALEGRSVVTFASDPLPSASPCPAQRCTIYLQDDDAVGEGRVTASIAAQARAANGVVLASRDETVTFRTFRVAPYAALAGSLDASLLRLSGAGEGDDGGAAPDGTAPGSLIDVLYENRTTKKTMPANVWRSQVQRPGTTPEAWSP